MTPDEALGALSGVKDHEAELRSTTSPKIVEEMLPGALTQNKASMSRSTTLPRDDMSVEESAKRYRPLPWLL